MTHLIAAPRSPASGDTWGLSGPTFLLLYLALACCVMIAALAARRAMRARSAPAHDTRELEADGDGPYLAAYLHGGPRVALLAALSSLRVAGLVRGRDRRCERVGMPTSGWRPRLEQAVLGETDRPRRAAQLIRQPPVAGALDALRDELVRRGLLVSDRERVRYLRLRWAMVAVLALGAARLLAGASAGKAVTFLSFSLMVLFALTIVLWASPPRRTVLGDARLSRLRSEYEHLSPAMRPDWVANGAVAAALAVGAFGAGALWTADPSFAEEVGAKATVGGGGVAGGGSGCGGGGGGCGGGGGGGGCGG